MLLFLLYCIFNCYVIISIIIVIVFHCFVGSLFLTETFLVILYLSTSRPSPYQTFLSFLTFSYSHVIVKVGSHGNFCNTSQFLSPGSLCNASWKFRMVMLKCLPPRKLQMALVMEVKPFMQLANMSTLLLMIAQFSDAFFCHKAVRIMSAKTFGQIFR